MPQLPFSLDTQPQLLQQALQRPVDTPLLHQGTRSYTLGDLRAQAHAIAQRLLSPSHQDLPPIGIYVESPFLLAASLLGAWQARRDPVLIDPSSRNEIQTLLERFPNIEFLCTHDHPTPHAPLPIPSPAPSPTPPPITPSLTDPIVSFFTSGSEGDSKLVPKQGRQIYAHIAAVSQMLAVPQGCRTLSFVPLFHILGFSYGLMVPLRAQGQIRVCVGQTPMAMRETLLTYKPDLVVASAIHYRILNAILQDDDSLPEAVYISSGAPLPANTRETFEEKTKRTITQLYGSTETSGIARRQGDDPWTPYPGVTFAIEEDLLRVRSPWASYQDPDAWVQTHDIAQADGEGFQLLGRAGNIVKVGGKRFSSTEVEHTLRTHPAVQDAAAVVTSRFGEPALAVFVVRQHDVTIATLRAYLAERLAPFKLPRSWHFLSELPRKKLQKLDYATLRQLAQQESSATQG